MESEATSYTGVRGLMMLTQDTADLIGVTDRTDPRQSVLGGTKYLVQLRKQIDDEVAVRTTTTTPWRPTTSDWPCAGCAGDRQARRPGPYLVEQPARRAALALQTRVIHDVEVRKARGQEPVRYVDSIRNYYSLLSRLESRPDSNAAALKGHSSVSRSSR